MGVSNAGEGGGERERETHSEREKAFKDEMLDAPIIIFHAPHGRPPPFPASVHPGGGKPALQVGVCVSILVRPFQVE